MRWHQQARLATKRVSADDLAACAKWLGANGFGDAKHLGIAGGSAGGFLMGLALTRNPELYRAVVSSVGIYDMLRVELTPNGAFNVTEFGTVKDRAQFAWMRQQSPYHNVRKGVAYPAVLMTTGENDGRVDPYNSRKMVAALQADSSSPHPILLLQKGGEGHGIGNSFQQTVDATAEALRVLLESAGGLRRASAGDEGRTPTRPGGLMDKARLIDERIIDHVLLLEGSIDEGGRRRLSRSAATRGSEDLHLCRRRVHPAEHERLSDRARAHRCLRSHRLDRFHACPAERHVPDRGSRDDGTRVRRPVAAHAVQRRHLGDDASDDRRRVHLGQRRRRRHTSNPFYRQLRDQDPDRVAVHGRIALGTEPQPPASNVRPVRIDDGVKREILARADIGEVIGAYVTLRKRGKDLVGLCPFHGEKTPSFHVHPDRGFFKCFGCDAKGDVLTFVQKQENVGFTDALRMLGKRYGVEVENEDPRAARVRSEKEAIYHANDVARAFFHRMLLDPLEGAEARAYCAGRAGSPRRRSGPSRWATPDAAGTRWSASCGATTSRRRSGSRPGSSSPTSAAAFATFIASG